MNKRKVLELFAGYGSQHLALKRLGIDCECDISEIDKYAIQTYNMIHGETKNYGDICKIDENTLPYYDLITYSAPCTDISVAGKTQGLTKDSGTRSSLLWECERIITKVKPKYLLLENVKNLVGKKFKADFNVWLKKLEELGYNNYWQVLNAKNYNIPQNRERVFVVSIRKDVDFKGYKFPNGMLLTKQLKDVLETNVDEKYYLDGVKVEKFMDNLMKGFKNASQYPTSQAGKVHDGDTFSTLSAGTHGYSNGYIKEPLIAASRGRNPLNPSDRMVGSPTEQRLELNMQGTSNTITTVQKDNLVVEGMLDIKGNEQVRRVYSPNGISPCLNTMQGGNRQPKIIIDENIKPSVRNNIVNEQELIVESEKEIYQCKCESGWQDNKVGLKVSPTIRANNSFTLGMDSNFRIRKLTPHECWRLMGVDDSDFDKIKGISNSQLYKMAGNSIVVDVLYYIFKQLLIEGDNDTFTI